MSSLQLRIGLPTDLMSVICHSLLLVVPLLSFIWAMSPAHFHFALVISLTKSGSLHTDRVVDSAS